MVEQKSTSLDFGILLGLAYQSFTDLLRAFMARRGFDDLGGAYGYVFRALADDRPSQRELARGLGITDQGMAKIITEMVQRGYVERRTDPDDSRVKRLTLGKRGRAALKVARQFHAEFEAELSQNAGQSAVRGLRRLLLQIAERGGDQVAAHARLRPT
jgi:DNA-binding MarR family transcriptional regulator